MLALLERNGTARGEVKLLMGESVSLLAELSVDWLFAELSVDWLFVQFFVERGYASVFDSEGFGGVLVYEFF